jgi:hypothetical protein
VRRLGHIAPDTVQEAFLITIGSTIGAMAAYFGFRGWRRRNDKRRHGGCFVTTEIVLANSK